MSLCTPLVVFLSLLAPSVAVLVNGVQGPRFDSIIRNPTFAKSFLPGIQTHLIVYARNDTWVAHIWYPLNADLTFSSTPPTYIRSPYDQVDHDSPFWNQLSTCDASLFFSVMYDTVTFQCSAVTKGIDLAVASPQRHVTVSASEASIISVIFTNATDRWTVIGGLHVNYQYRYAGSGTAMSIYGVNLTRTCTGGTCGEYVSVPAGRAITSNVLATSMASINYRVVNENIICGSATASAVLMCGYRPNATAPVVSTASLTLNGQISAIRSDLIQCVSSPEARGGQLCPFDTSRKTEGLVYAGIGSSPSDTICGYRISVVNSVISLQSRISCITTDNPNSFEVDPNAGTTVLSCITNGLRNYAIDKYNNKLTLAFTLTTWGSSCNYLFDRTGVTAFVANATTLFRYSIDNRTEPIVWTGSTSAQYARFVTASFSFAEVPLVGFTRLYINQYYFNITFTGGYCSLVIDMGAITVPILYHEDTACFANSWNGPSQLANTPISAYMMIQDQYYNTPSFTTPFNFTSVISTLAPTLTMSHTDIDAFSLAVTFFIRIPLPPSSPGVNLTITDSDDNRVLLWHWIGGYTGSGGNYTFTIDVTDPLGSTSNFTDLFNTVTEFNGGLHTTDSYTFTLSYGNQFGHAPATFVIEDVWIDLSATTKTIVTAQTVTDTATTHTVVYDSTTHTVTITTNKINTYYNNTVKVVVASCLPISIGTCTDTDMSPLAISLVVILWTALLAKIVMMAVRMSTPSPFTYKPIQTTETPLSSSPTPSSSLKQS